MKTRSLKARYTSEYCALKNAIDRCTRSNHPQFKDYGGRGITVDPLFLDPIGGFEAFLEAVGPKPKPALTLDRVDNDKGYVVGNLAWTSRQVQQRHRRHPDWTRNLGWGTGSYTLVDRNGTVRTHYSALIPLGDRIQTLKEWSRELGIPAATIKQRIQRGWTPEQALTPVLFNPRGKPRLN
ncbi:hypothetical protein [Sphingomonas xinjiangensis]|uniref:HNH endonuclease n=1 Tax=Sphingomonas xinjiangensis TaxID=643568 RepID=A0A840YDA6_9SPHN|nr:hypothetical protein [Sphingomonas xinjiangensis]MBB5710834.1 hypothetical protein [Sphingomonas xinjiangensis]